MMQTLFSELEAAMEAEITPKVLDLLVEYARQSVERGEKHFAADVLALALQYPMRIETLEEAEAIYSALEAELAPTMIRDACRKAQMYTLEDMVSTVLAKATN